jgi:hypothetical protein
MNHGLFLSLFTMSVLVVSILILSTETTKSASAATNDSNIEQDQGWNTFYMIGKFLYDQPPKPDQISKFYYKVSNGTVESFTGFPHIALPDNNTSPLLLVANVSSNSTTGLLQVKYPRDYPFMNFPPNIGPNASRTLVVFVKPQDKPEQEVHNYTATDCFYDFSIPFTGKTTITVGAAYIPERFPYRGEDVPTGCLADTIVPDVPTKKDGTIAPLQQFMAGVAAKDVVCPAKYPQLVIRSDGMPYCVDNSMLAFLHKVWGSFAVLTIPKA